MVDQINDDKVCYRTRKTVLEMLDARGYQID